MTKINDNKSPEVTHITIQIIAKYYTNLASALFTLETRFPTVNLDKDFLKSTCKIYGEKWIFYCAYNGGFHYCKDSFFTSFFWFIFLKKMVTFIKILVTFKQIISKRTINIFCINILLK